MDKLRFTIQWSGSETASLDELRDNGNIIVPPPVKSTPGGVSVEYPVPVAASHSIAWTLGFPGKTLRKLRATAAVNGGAAQKLGEEEKEAKNLWQGQDIAWSVVVGAEHA